MILQYQCKYLPVELRPEVPVGEPEVLQELQAKVLEAGLQELPAEVLEAGLQELQAEVVEAELV